MFQRIRRHAGTILVAVVTATLASGGGAVAALTVVDYARNAGKVDGWDARSHTGNATRRVRQLVATDGTGHLPNNIIRKAPDANRLDGVDSTGFLRTSAASDFLPSGGKATDADKLDGADSTEFLRTSAAAGFLGAGAKAVDSDKLDGQDSSAFAQAGALPWQQVQPIPGPFDTPPGHFRCVVTSGPTCVGGWENHGGGYGVAQFARDAFGLVHVAGVVKCTGGGAPCNAHAGQRIFTLPAGFRPAAGTVFATLATDALARITITSEGHVILLVASGGASYVSLDGITFPAGP